MSRSNDGDAPIMSMEFLATLPLLSCLTPALRAALSRDAGGSATLAAQQRKAKQILRQAFGEHWITDSVLACKYVARFRDKYVASGRAIARRDSGNAEAHLHHQDHFFTWDYTFSALNHRPEHHRVRTPASRWVTLNRKHIQATFLDDQQCRRWYQDHDYQGMVFAVMGHWSPQKEPSFILANAYDASQGLGTVMLLRCDAGELSLRRVWQCYERAMAEKPALGAGGPLDSTVRRLRVTRTRKGTSYTSLVKRALAIQRVLNAPRKRDEEDDPRSADLPLEFIRAFEREICGKV